MFVDHDLGRSISILGDPLSRPIARLDYASAPKPFLHPVSTPGGVLMTLIEPDDHLWHRGLWFTFKFVDGDNFWEERDDFGRQRVAGIPQVSHPDQTTTVIDLDLDWMAPGATGPVLTEQRRLTIRVIEDATQIDLATTLRATADVTLDRTPYTTWGGYGGLAFRATAHWQPSQRTAGDRITDGFLLGETAPWCDVSGPITASALTDPSPGEEPNDAIIDRSAGVAILDHPANPRHPTPWYTGSGAGNFLNAALLFHEPMALATGATLDLRYRVLVHDGTWGVADLRRQFERYVAEPD